MSSRKLKMRDAMQQPEPDRAQVEELRKSFLELADRASKEVLDDLFAVTEVLTVEQRTELIEDWKNWSH